MSVSVEGIGTKSGFMNRSAMAVVLFEKAQRERKQTQDVQSVESMKKGSLVHGRSMQSSNGIPELLRRCLADRNPPTRLVFENLTVLGGSNGVSGEAPQSRHDGSAPPSTQ